MDYTVIYEQTPNGYSAYVPDLPGCVAAGTTRREVARLIASAIHVHLEAMREGGFEAPPPTTRADTVRVAARRHRLRG